MTRWHRTQLRMLARRMVRLETMARRAELAGKTEPASEFWRRREEVQWLRSLLLRHEWAERHSATVP